MIRQCIFINEPPPQLGIPSVVRFVGSVEGWDVASVLAVLGLDVTIASLVVKGLDAVLCSLVGLPVVRGLELAIGSLVTEGLEVVVGTLDVEGSVEGVL